MPFLLAEILNFQGSTPLIGVGSFSNLIKRARRTDAEPIICSLKYCCYRLFFDLICAPNNHIGAKSELLLVVL